MQIACSTNKNEPQYFIFLDYMEEDHEHLSIQHLYEHHL
jgi:hypothetical protein